MNDTMTNTLESPRTPDELRIDARQIYVKVAESIHAAEKAGWHEKFQKIEEAMRYLRIGESVYQKIKYQYIQMLYLVAQQAQQHAKDNPHQAHQALQYIETILQYFVALDKEQAVERVKSENMQRWIRGHYSHVNTIRKQTQNVLAAHHKNAQRKQTSEEHIQRRQQREQQRQQHIEARRAHAEAQHKQVIEEHKQRRAQSKKAR